MRAIAIAMLAGANAFAITPVATLRPAAAIAPAVAHAVSVQQQLRVVAVADKKRANQQQVRMVDPAADKKRVNALLKSSAAMAAALTVVLASPTAAFAKGGGHGSGGHSSHSSHSSHTSMSRSYRAPSSPSRSSYRAPSSPSRSSYRPPSSPSRSSYRAPSSPSRSRSSSSRSRRSSSTSSSPGRVGGRVYRSKPPSPPVYAPPVYEPSYAPSYEPSPTVLYEQSPSVVYRSSPSRTVVVDDSPFWDGVWAARLEGVTIAGLAAYAYQEANRGDAKEGESDESDEYPIDYDRELAETRELMRELTAELAREDDALIAAIEKPKDGSYTGESAEDDGGDQEVSTWLRFGRDGTVSGRGRDGVDGLYSIREGSWSKKRVAWIEEYDEGFTVALRGQVRPDGSILGLWASSRGVGGSVALKAP